MKELFTYSYYSEDKLAGTNNNATYTFKPPKTDKPTTKFTFRLANWVISQQSNDYNNTCPVMEIRFSFTSNYVYNSRNINYLSMYQDTAHNGLITRLPEFVIDINGTQTFNLQLYNPIDRALLLDDTNGLPGSYGFVFELVPIY